MKNAIIGYDLLPKYWGKGFTTEAVHRIVKAAFLSELPCGKLNRIQGVKRRARKTRKRFTINAENG
ncbi:GNAT family N-acetyltransferase [Pseudoalteromonas sp. Hal099]